jgi:hypothetical protein
VINRQKKYLLSLGAIGVCLFFISSGYSQKPMEKPITKDELFKVLETKLTISGAKHLIKRIQENKVSFELNDSDKDNIRRLQKGLGQKSLDDLIAAIKSNVSDVAQQLSPNPQSNTPTFQEGIENVAFSLGEEGMSVLYPIRFIEKQPAHALTFDERNFVDVYVKGGKLYADVTVYDESGTPIPLLRQNKFIMGSPSWDRNFNDQAFEVVDANGSPVFQLIYRTQSWIVVKGIFQRSNSVVLADKDVRVISGHKVPSDFSIKRIFKYPSYKYLGQVE